MAHFARVENGIVTDVVVVANEHEANGNEYLNDLGLVGTWVQTSYNSNIRGKFASVGDIYDAEEDLFKPEKRHPSWVWNATIWNWDAPFPAPAEEGYRWDEAAQDWVAIN